VFVKEVPAEKTINALSPPEQVALKLPTISKFKVAGDPPNGESELEIVLLVLHPPVDPSEVV
jgi:carbon monoxide dehydrogenase subunit G